MNPYATLSAAGAAFAAGGICAWAGVAPSAQLFGPTICATGDSGAIALTFDDGPNPTATPMLLDLLERHKVHASFFLIGRHVRAFPSLAKEIAARGHAERTQGCCVALKVDGGLQVALDGNRHGFGSGPALQM